MESPPSDRSRRLGAARLRARRAKTALAACAVAVFALVGIAVRAAHPGTHSSGTTRSPLAQLETPADFESALSQSDDSSQGDSFIAPAQAPPAAATSTS